MSKFPLAGRGVYYQPFATRADEEFLFAVDSQGHKIAELTVPKGNSSERYELALWRLLDEFDPKVVIPRLQVIAGGAR
jgi:hypothetical protein